jgi:hypothetical protein
VEIGLLVDALRLVGLDGLAQVDLSRRKHRNQEIGKLGRMSSEILQVVLERLRREGRLALDAPVADVLPALAGLRMPSGEPPPRPPTVRDLMRHTSGVAYPGEIRDARVREAVQATGLFNRMPFIADDDFIAGIAAAPTKSVNARCFAPGSR